MNPTILAGIAAITLQVTSPAFNDNDFIPAKYTCEGQNISPAIEVKNIPPQTKTLAIIVDDPDAPNGTFVHWVAWNLPPENIAENVVVGMMGKNGRGSKGYTGPCPPSGTHHYHFNVYALDANLSLQEAAGKEELKAAMEGHILGSGELIGLYKKTKQ